MLKIGGCGSPLIPKFIGLISLFLSGVSLLITGPISPGSFYQNGKLLSGWIHGDVGYQHILVEEGQNSRPCFKLIQKGIRISNQYVKSSHRTRDKEECERQCLAATTFSCRAFNYRYKSYTSLYVENCELSNQDTYGVDLSDRYVFYSDPDFDFYERTGLGSDCDGDSTSGREDYDCFKLYEKESRLDSRVVSEQLNVRDLDSCKEECYNARYFKCQMLSFSYSSYWYGKDNCLLSKQSSSYMGRYDTVYDKYFDLYERDEDSYGNCRNGGGNGGDNPYGRENVYETVSGHRCYRDPCQEDRYGRFYYCETSETGGWDYCCRPGSYCTEPNGRRNEWCYVGNEMTNQWRPCSYPLGAASQFRRSFLMTPKVGNSSWHPVTHLTPKLGNSSWHPVTHLTPKVGNSSWHPVTHLTPKIQWNENYQSSSAQIHEQIEVTNLSDIVP